MNDVMTVKLATRREIADKLDRLAVSADVKLLMTQLAALTMKVGDAIVEVGRRVMSFVFETVKLFPHITLGVIVGFTMWWLIGSAAILGALLGPIIGPLLVAFGLGVGAMADVADGGLRARVEALAHSFETAGQAD